MAVCERFGEGDPEEAIEEFNKLMQTGSVSEYLERFKQLKSIVMVTLPGQPDSYYKSCFLSGLKEEIVNMVRMTRPLTLADTIETAKLQEKNLEALRKSQGKMIGPVQKEPFGVGEPLEESGKDTEEFCDCPEGELSNENIEVSIHALAGGTEHKTLKLKGRIAGVEILILVDSGSTHCFIDERLAETIQLPTIGNPLTVRVANGEQLESRQLQGAVQWEMQGNQFTHQFNTLKLGSCHMVLGVDWLARYSPIEFDFRQLSMRFLQGGQPVELKGEVSKLKLKAIKGSKLAKWRKKQTYGISAQLCVMEEGEEDTEVIPAEMRSLLDQFKGVFAEPQGMPPRRSHDHSIPLKQGAIPFQVRPYRCPYVQKTEIERLVKEMLQMGIIQPSNSHFASPVLLVKKKDGSWRFCVDYRQLNELTMKDKFPMPLIDELLDELHGSKYFTKIDLRAGYHQIRVKVEDIHKTTFRTHQGLYEFKVMPFGLTNAPTTFQSLMNHIFRDQLRRYVLVFFDDILIYSPSLEIHLQQVAEVLNLLQEHQLYAKKSKCSFAQTEVEYLGHIISGQGVRADHKKVEGMMNWPTPTSVKELKGFLGLTGYYRRFVKGYGATAKPLTILLKKDGFHWNEAADEAFQKLKLAMCSTPVLALPDFTKQFVVETDACYGGIGAKWLTKLLGLSYEIQYRKGKENIAADALSRRAGGQEGDCTELTCVLPEWMKEVIGSYQGDEEVQNMIRQIVRTPGNPPEHSYQDGILRYKGRIVVGSAGEIRKKIIATLHESQLGGHSGVQSS
ncbi:uncharacterized protein [Coffea arabica]|uniref:Reverse transcriptase domain-containing protein n=1 Tax=Coffea arabica TaxID=13443 RepID=A0A6P6U0D3_COFAR